jgi:hypothetical protein
MVALNRKQGRAADDGGAFPFPTEPVDALLVERLRRACDPFSTIDIDEHAHRVAALVSRAKRKPFNKYARATA